MSRDPGGPAPAPQPCAPLHGGLFRESGSHPSSSCFLLMKLIFTCDGRDYGNDDVDSDGSDDMIRGADGFDRREDQGERNIYKRTSVP